MTSESPHHVDVWRHHRAFGLAVRSRLPLPEFGPEILGDDRWDVEIDFGPVPLQLPDATSEGVRYQAAKGRLLLKVEQVARYYVENGCRVVIDRDPAAPDEDVRIFLLSSVFGALLHQREDFVLHGSAIDYHGDAVAFLGFSGAGKSTLAAAFGRRGHPILTDDQCVVRRGVDDVMQVHPGYPQMKLWLDSLAQLELSAEGLRRLRQKIGKRALPLGEEFAVQPRPFRKAYVLFPANHDELRLEPVDGARQFNLLKSHTFRPGFMKRTGASSRHFEDAMRLARQIPLAIAVRPKSPFRLDELVALIEADLRA